MKIYSIADLHLATDSRIDKPMNLFGPGWEGHPDKLLATWKEKITDEDIVIIPGDISWGLKLDEAMADFELLHSLPGKKLISKGNHDLWWSRIKYLNSLYDDITFRVSIKKIFNSSHFLPLDNFGNGTLIPALVDNRNGIGILAVPSALRNKRSLTCYFNYVFAV